MESLNGLQLNKFNSSLKKMGDFLFHEGPIQSHFINEKNEDYLFFWADADDQSNRWMVVKSSLELLHRFFSKNINTRDLIMQNPDGHVYFIDIDASGNWPQIFQVPNAAIPGDYFPSADSYYLAEHYEKYAHELKTYLDHYFARKEKLYAQPEPEALFANEPSVPYKPKK